MKMPQNSDSGAGEFDAVELAAADWFARQEFGLSSAEETELTAWLQADARHAAIFGELQRTSGVLDRWPVNAAARVAPMESSLPTMRMEARRSRWFAASGLAAAAVIVIAALIGGRTFIRDDVPYIADAITDVGGLRVLKLPDGSTVQLNTDSAVRVDYSETERRVRLMRGEASFSVAKNPSRPFFVDASGVSVRAVGTAFNVRLRPEAVEVLVTEGRVRVDETAGGGTLLAAAGKPDRKTNPEPILSAGQRVVVPLTDASPLAPAMAKPIAPAQIEQALAWQDRRLKFEATPLSEVVAEFNRYNRHKLVIEDPTLAEQKFGGTFRPDGYETLIGLLEQSFDVVVERRESATILRRGSR